MASNAQVSVTTTATILGSGAGGSASDPQTYIVRLDPLATANVFIGDKNVTTSNGFLLQPGDGTSIDLIGDPLYAVAASGTQTVYILRRK